MIATGFDFEPLPTGDVLIQFFRDDGRPVNTQVITRECLARFPVVAHAFLLAVEEGKEAALAFLDDVTARGHKQHGGDVEKTTMRSGGDR